jgi:hypothetical protein
MRGRRKRREFRLPWRQRENLPAVAYLTSDGRGGEVPKWSFPAEFQVQTDLSPARWIEEGLPKHPWATVGSLVPEGFEAYARVMHPAHRDPGSRTVTWAEVAEIHGHTIHRLAQFPKIADLQVPSRASFRASSRSLSSRSWARPPTRRTDAGSPRGSVTACCRFWRASRTIR